MKKLISMLLALVMVVSLATVAFAADGAENDYEDYLDVDPVLTKVYTQNNGTAPSQTFTFSFTGKTYVNNEGEKDSTVTIPTIPNQKITMSGAGTETVTVELENVNFEKLGVYTYEVKEVIPTTKTAGVNYTTTPLYMVVTVLRSEDSTKHYVAALHFQTVEGNKTNAKFTNTYDAGTLTIEKKIAGNMAEMTKKFPFTVVLTAPEGAKFDDSVQVMGGEATLNADGTITVTQNLGNNEKLEITNIPAGTTYVISEENGSYTQTVNENNTADGKIEANDTDSVVYTNTLNQGVDTGITLDSIPFILILAVCTGAVVLFVIKKRNTVDF